MHATPDKITFALMSFKALKEAFYHLCQCSSLKTSAKSSTTTKCCCCCYRNL